MSSETPDQHPLIRTIACEFAIMALIDALQRNGQSEVANTAFKAAMSYSMQMSDMQDADPEQRLAKHVKYLFRSLDDTVPRFK